MAKNSKSTSDYQPDYSFPRTDIAKRLKDESWHRQFTLAIVHESIGGANYDLDYAAMNESVTYFNGDQGGSEFNFIQESEDGEVLPAVWINFNRIRVRIETLMGEFQARGYTINASSINKEAKSRKIEARQQAKVDMNLAPERQELERDFGLDLAPQRQVFESEEELDDHFNSFKEKNEKIMQAALRWLSKKHKWMYERLSAYRDLRIMGKCFYEMEIKDGLPYAAELDPRFVVFDTSATDDFLSDSTYFAKIKYMTLADTASKYGLSEEEIHDVYGKWQDYSRTGISASTSSFFDSILGSNLQYFKQQGNDLRVLVLEAYWLDQEVLTHRESVDKQGGEHIKQVSDEAKSGELRHNTIAQWRKATLIGGDLIKDWGIIENSVRDNEALAETSCPIKGLVPHFLNGRGVSVTHQMKGLQKLKDITLYNLQLEMTTAGRKGFVYDVSQTPEGWKAETVLKYLKTSGVAFIDSKKDGLPSTHNQFNPIDQTLSQSVEQYIRISQMVDSEMDAITGVNYARQGQSTGANQGLGVTQTALMQSAMSTKTVDDLFMMLNEQVLNHMAGLVKISAAGNEKYAPIIGDDGIEFLEDTMDLELDDFAVFMEEVPPILDDLQSFRGIVEAALTSGAVSFPDAANLLIEKDITVGIKRLERSIEKREAAGAKANEQAVQQQQMAAQAAADQLAAAKLQELQAGTQGQLQVEGLKGDFKVQDRNLDGRQNIDEIITAAKTDATQSKQDFAEDTSLKSQDLKGQLAQLKENQSARGEAKKSAKAAK
jgi:hypothetical protein